MSLVTAVTAATAVRPLLRCREPLLLVTVLVTVTAGLGAATLPFRRARTDGCGCGGCGGCNFDNLWAAAAAAAGLETMLPVLFRVVRT